MWTVNYGVSNFAQDNSIDLEPDDFDVPVADDAPGW